MKTIKNFQYAEINTAFASKVFGGGEMTTSGSDPKKFDNLTITVQVTGLMNQALVKAAGGETSGSFTTSNASSNGSTVTVTTAPSPK